MLAIEAFALGGTSGRRDVVFDRSGIPCWVRRRWQLRPAPHPRLHPIQARLLQAAP